MASTGKERKKKREKKEKGKARKGGGEPRVLKTKRWCPLAGTWGRSRKMAPASLCPEGHPPWRPPDTHASRSLPFRPALQDQQMSLSPRTAESLYGRLALGLEVGESWGPLRALPRSAISGGWVGWVGGVVFKARHLDPRLSDAGRKSCPVWGSSPLLLREKLWVWSSHPTVGCSLAACRVGFMGVLCPNMAYLLSCGPFLLRIGCTGIT